jgi:hypothetical protein
MPAADELLKKSFSISEFGDRLILPYPLQGSYSSIIEKRDVEGTTQFKQSARSRTGCL